MKLSKLLVRALALLSALALCLPCALAEELGELDLYDPAIYIDDGQSAPEKSALPEFLYGEPVDAPTPEATVEPTAEPTVEPTVEPTPELPEEAAVSEETPIPEEAAVSEETPVPEETPAPEAGEADPEAGEAAPEATVEPAEPVESAEPSEEPAEEPTVEPTGEPTAEPTGEPTPEPTPEPLMADPDAEIAAPAADLTLGLGEAFQLDGAAILGGAAPTGYASDHPEIAAVDPATGIVTGVALGTATLAVSGGGATVNYTVAVLNAPAALAFPVGALDLGKGETRPFPASAPAGSGAAHIAYASSKPKVVTVDAAGNLVAKKTGTAVITATAYNGATATCAVRVWKAPSKVKLPYKTGCLSIGETRTLAVTLSKNSVSPIAWSSDNPGIVAVDAAGTLVGVAPGVATVTARSFNNKRATCKVTVLNGTAPTALSLNAAALTLGAKETFQLVPALNPGEAAVFTYSSSAKKIAAVTANGLVTGKKAGTATITVKTQNGLTAQVAVTVGKAPKKIALSASGMTLVVGQSAQLGATLTAGSVAQIRWESSDPSVATVDGGGLVTGLKAGTAVVRASTFNKKSALCKVVVADVSDATILLPQNDASAEEAELTAADMVANLKRSSVLGSKRDAIVGVVQLLMDNGFEPAFAAGVAANVYSEGTYGLFESSRYVSNYQKRPKYFCYLDGGAYYSLVNGEYEVTAVYLSQEDYEAYTGTATKMLRFGEENFYLNNYSGRYAQNVDLAALETFLDTLAEGKWQGKFGLGIVQWTGARTRKLVSFYRKHAGDSDKLTAAQVVAAENEMILYDLKGSYSGVYTGWRSANEDRATADAARSAGALVCTKYEIPANKETKAVTRGNKAAEIFNVMMGN